MTPRLLGSIVFQVLAVAAISGFATYLLGDTLRGQIYPALWIFGGPVLLTMLFNHGMKRRAAMYVLLTLISVLTSGYILVFAMGYY